MVRSDAVVLERVAGETAAVDFLALPGIGAYFTSASQTRDYPMIMALVLLVCVLWGTLYLLSDVAYTLADPRVRLEGLAR